MPTGRVKWFDERKGYGFIAPESGSDVFVHYTGIEGTGFKTLHEGQEVEFETEQGDKGLKAVNVRIVGGEVPSSTREWQSDEEEW